MKKSTPTPPSRLLLALALPAVATVLLYAPTLGYQMAYDDGIAVVGSLARIREHGVIDLLSQGRALKVLSFALDEWLFGRATWGYHLHSVLWAAAGAVLVGCVAYALDWRLRTLILAGLLFAVHPVHVEAVANLASRKDPMAAAFGLGALLLVLPALRRGALPGWRHALPAAGLLALSFLCKEVVGVGIAGVLLALMFVPAVRAPDAPAAGPSRRRLALALALLAGAASASLLLVQRFTKGGIGQLFVSERLQMLSAGSITTPLEWFVGAGSGVARSLGLLVFPAGLSADHPVPPGGPAGTVLAVVGMGLLAGLFVAAFRLRQPLLALGSAWLLPTLMPVINLLPLSYFFVAERYLYLPSAGVVLVALGALNSLEQRAGPRRGARARAVVLLPWALVVLGALTTWAREPVWRNNRSLWAATVEENPLSFRAHANLGRELMLAGHYDAAERHLKLALELAYRPSDRARTLCSLGGTQLLRGVVEPALASLSSGLEIRPADRDCRSALALALLRAGDENQALLEARKAADLNGRVALENLIRIYDHLGRRCDAATVCVSLRQIHGDGISAGVAAYCAEVETACGAPQRGS